MFEKTDHPGFLINRKTGVVINKNDNDLRRYQQQVLSEKNVKTIEQEMSSLRNELEELKKLIKANNV